jgi:hypothetical protein
MATFRRYRTDPELELRDSAVTAEKALRCCPSAYVSSGVIAKLTTASLWPGCVDHGGEVRFGVEQAATLTVVRGIRNPAKSPAAHRRRNMAVVSSFGRACLRISLGPRNVAARMLADEAEAEATSAGFDPRRSPPVRCRTPGRSGIFKGSWREGNQRPLLPDDGEVCPLDHAAIRASPVISARSCRRAR